MYFIAGGKSPPQKVILGFSTFNIKLPSNESSNSLWGVMNISCIVLCEVDTVCYIGT